MALQGRLHLQVRAGAELLGRHEGVGQRRLGAERLAEEGMRVVLDGLGARGAVALEHAALVAEVEHRLDAARDVAGQQRDGAGGRDRGEEAVADAVAGDGLAHLLRQALHMRRRQEALGVVEREGALLARQLGACQIGRPLDGRHPALRQCHRLRRAVAHAAEDQGVGEPGDAEADAPLGLGLLLLRGQRVVGDVDGVVEEAHGCAGERFEASLVEPRLGRKRLVDQSGQIDRAQQARAVRRKRLLTAIVRN